MTGSSFHDGEIALQQRAGSFARLQTMGPMVIRAAMPDQHREFFPLLPFLLVGSVDASGQPWASVLAGPCGFAHSPAPDLLRIDAQPLPADPLADALREGQPVGLLGLQPHTRRRNRMNGRVVALDARGFTVRVGQSFGNCPKYIQSREPLFVPERAAPAPVPEWLDGLDEPARQLIARADTFFIATAHPRARDAGTPSHGVDVSHRGGPAGFVRVDAQGGLRVPDFVGNGYFNTLGNLGLEARCGLLFIDFASGDLLLLAAHGTLHWPQEAEPAAAGTAWTPRSLHLRVERALRLKAALPLRWR